MPEAQTSHQTTPIKELKPWQNAVVGFLAGAIEITTLQPMLYAKNAVQQNLPLTLNPMVLYRGLVMSVANMSITVGVQLPLTNMSSKLLTGTPLSSTSLPHLSDAQLLLSGFMGGAMSGFFCTTTELVIIQQQRFGGSIFSVGSNIAKVHGFPTLFRGLSTTCSRESFFATGYLGITPIVTRKLVENGQDLSTAKIGASISAAVISATLSHPFDTIKTCMQGDIAKGKYRGLVDTAATLLRENGVSRFFNGWTWRTGRMCFAMYILSECKTVLGDILFPN